MMWTPNRRRHETPLGPPPHAVVWITSGEANAEWTRLRSANFTFVGDASERQIRRVAQQLEQFREVMMRALPPSGASSPAPIVVIVFANDRSFEPFKPRFQGRTVEVAGFFQGGQDVNFIAVNGDLGADAVRTVFHEYSHFLVSSTLRLAPVWVSESLAGVYETFQERDGGKSAVLGLAPAEYVRELRSQTLIPLSQLTVVDRSSPMYNEGNRRGLLYAQSWALMHYFRFGSAARGAQFVQYLTHTWWTVGGWNRRSCRSDRIDSRRVRAALCAEICGARRFNTKARRHGDARRKSRPRATH